MGSEISRDDVDLVAARTGVSEDRARAALERAEGDLAAAVEAVEHGSVRDPADQHGSVGTTEIPPEDIDLVATRTGVSEDRARVALERADGDLAAAVARVGRGSVGDPNEEQPSAGETAIYEEDSAETQSDTRIYRAENADEDPEQ